MKSETDSTRLFHFGSSEFLNLLTQIRSVKMSKEEVSMLLRRYGTGLGHPTPNEELIDQRTGFGDIHDAAVEVFGSVSIKNDHLGNPFEVTLGS